MRYFEWLVKWLLPLFFIYDFLAKVLWYVEFTKMFYFLACLFKAFLILFLLILAYNKILFNKNIIYVAIIITISFLVGQLVLYGDISTENLLFNGYYFISSLCPLVFFAFMYNYNDTKTLEKSVMLFSILLTFNSVFVFIGLISKINFFETYAYGNRFGFKGLLSYHSELGYIYFIGLSALYFKFKMKKKKVFLILILVNFLAIFLIGTKKAIFLALLFLIFFLIDNKFLIGKEFSLKTRLILFFGLFFIGLIPVKNVFIYFYELYERQGFASAFFSFRNVLLKEKFYPYIKDTWYSVNYIVGGPSFHDSRIEMELFDVYLFFGIIGLIGYFFLFRMLLKKSNNYLLSFITYSIILATIFSGNLLSSINVMTCFFLTFLYIINYQKST